MMHLKQRKGERKFRSPQTVEEPDFASSKNRVLRQSDVSLGGVSMGIAGSICDSDFMQKYLGLRAEWVYLTEILRRIKLEIYDKDEYEKALKWIKGNCKEGYDVNAGKEFPEIIKKSKVVDADKDWEFIAKFTIIVNDILHGNEKLKELGSHEEALGRNAVVGGFQGQKMWTDWLPNADFTESLLASSFDWNGKKQPFPFATENDTLNGIAILFGTLLTNKASCFYDVRTYWSPEAVKRVTGYDVSGNAKDGFIHLINSGATAMDCAGAAKDENGNGVMKKWWEMTLHQQITEHVKNTDPYTNKMPHKCKRKSYKQTFTCFLCIYRSSSHFFFIYGIFIKLKPYKLAISYKKI